MFITRFGRRCVLAAMYSIAIANASYCQVVPVSNFGTAGRSVQRSSIEEYDGALYFGVGVDDTSERELWSFDGANLELVAGGFVGDSEIAVDEFTEFQGQLYFSANNGQHGQELYRYDGNRVTLAADIQAGSASSYPVGLFVHEEALYFSAKLGESFNSLWKFDGTNARRIASFNDPRASVVTGATYKGDLYFGADDGVRGMELWKYDGNGVTHVADLNSGAGDSFPREFTVVGDQLIFKATTDQHGQELWKYDGASASILQDINPGSKSSDPRNLTELDGELMFSAVAFGDRSVYRYGGTQAQTVVSGGGPLVIEDELFTIRGRHAGGVEVNDLHRLDGSLHRTTVPSAGPFEMLGEDMFFSCSCELRELYMLAPDGDVNFDGGVTFADFLTLVANFGRGGNWTAGDFNGDGMVAFEDFLLQAENFGVEPPNIQATVGVPEPGHSFRLLWTGTVAASIVWRKRRTLNVVQL